MPSIESNQVKAKRWCTRCRNHMDGNDGSFAPFERAINRHTNPAPYWKDLPLQKKLTSTHFFQTGSRVRTCNSP